MGKRKKNETGEGQVTGEQLELIDVGPANLKAIKPIAKRYKAAMRRRQGALKEEIEAKQQILALIKEAKVSRLPDGKIKFKCDGMLITVTPRDELVKVKDEEDEEDEENEEE